MSKENCRVWFFNQNSYLPEDGPHTRTFTMGKYMIPDGFVPFVFAGNELHHVGRTVDTEGKLFLEKIREGVHFFYIKTTPYHKNDFRRILNMVSYYRNLFRVSKAVAKEYGKPDIIYASSMYPTALLAGVKIAKKYRIPCICENRDLVPDGFISDGTIKKNGLIARAASKFMKKVLYRANAIVFTMEGGRQYIIDHKWDTAQGGKIDLKNVYYINNGVDLDEYHKNENEFILEDTDLDDPECFKVVYFGAVRLMNQMSVFVDTAKILKEKEPEKKIKILIWGAGTKLEEMQNRLKEAGLTNIVFKGYVDKRYIPGIAKRADLFIGTGNSCSVGKYGMSFNKLFDYLAAGKPVILPYKVAYSIVEKNGAGVELEETSAEKLAEEVLRFCRMDKAEYEAYCSCSKKTAEEFDYRKLTAKAEEIIGNLQG